jgi:hypothetical protein
LLSGRRDGKFLYYVTDEMIYADGKSVYEEQAVCLLAKNKAF